MKNKNKIIKNIEKIYMVGAIGITLLTVLTPEVYAASDPLAIVNNLSDFIFTLIRAVGIIIMGYSVVQIGLSFTTHDPSQRVNGFMFFVGGLIITFSKEILNLITG